MFPVVYEFRADPAHVVFSTFFVLAIVIVVLFAARAGWRARRRASAGGAGELRWHEDFEALPEERRACRFDPDRRRGLGACERGFACADCDRYACLSETRPMAECTIYVHGLPILAERGYHRGHTWVEEEASGTVLVGLDPLARRLFAHDDTLRCAEAGRPVRRGDAIFEDRDRGLRILTPLPGEVIEALGNGPETLVRLRPASRSRVELLRGPEAAGWLESELRWLSRRTEPAMATGATLADGGEVVDCLPEDLPAVDWPGLREEFFLDV